MIFTYDGCFQHSMTSNLSTYKDQQVAGHSQAFNVLQYLKSQAAIAWR